MYALFSMLQLPESPIKAVLSAIGGQKVDNEFLPGYPYLLCTHLQQTVS